MFCLACLILLWGLGFFFFSRNTFYIDLSPSVWVHFSLCHCFLPQFVCLSLKALVKSQILYSALKENKFQKTCIIKLELFLPILSPFPIYPVVLGS